MSIIKMFYLINTDEKMLEYNSHPQLNAKMKDYKVRLGFGLHKGWAIEGAIGSQYKLDASYLSSNAQIPLLLEESTKRYGMPYLFTHSIVQDLRQPQILEIIRLVDIVKVKQRKKPLKIYCIDLNFAAADRKLGNSEYQVQVKMHFDVILKQNQNVLNQ